MKPQLETDWVRDSPWGSRAELEAQRGADWGPHADERLCSHSLPRFHAYFLLRTSVRLFCLIWGWFFSPSFHHFVSNRFHFHKSLLCTCRCCGRRSNRTLPAWPWFALMSVTCVPRQRDFLPEASVRLRARLLNPATVLQLWSGLLPSAHSRSFCRSGKVE